MAIRKIPLRAQRPLDADGSPIGAEDPAEDSQVQIALEAIRKVVMTDRAVYDKVGESTECLRTMRVDHLALHRLRKLSSPSCARTQSMKRPIYSGSKILTLSA